MSILVLGCMLAAYAISRPVMGLVYVVQGNAHVDMRRPVRRSHRGY